ncbi:hypothetical protein Glove_543g109 [Diversispora epigaea]|uniref:Uncharacterized protein n=1 Tax=Diversispora epigaea TaxID=1348612 RepID=A0A397GCD5_9GLOM|nr:hypothetical protein Glove_543g109 [Diversispora epigaea]
MSLDFLHYKSSVVTAPRFKIIKSATISSAAISLATTVETTTSRLTSKRRRTEVRSVGQYSDSNIRKDVK